MSKSKPKPRTTLKARYVFPVGKPPMADGAVTFEGERIVSLGKARDPGTVIDLGNVAILPGLTNAHTHLEFSDLAAPLGRPGMGFVDWIQEVIRFRGQTGRPANAVSLGLAESTRSGVTALGEIAQTNWDSKVFAGQSLECVAYLEMIAPTKALLGQVMLIAAFHRMIARHSGCHDGLSPHAPYTVPLENLRRFIPEYLPKGMPVAMHLAESREERQFLRVGTGPFRTLLEEKVPPGAMRWPKMQRPMDFLRVLSQTERAAVIHGNYLDDDEIRFLGEHRDGMAVVYCPRTHAYFGHDPYPLAKMLEAGVTMALGTDSRASSPDLNLLNEMRFAAGRHPEVPFEQFVRMATLGGAQALGLEATCGTLGPRKHANLAIVRLPDRDAADPHELLFDSDEPVAATWHRGRQCWPQP
jgi:cytosine/adenosine deaminase-related metal-dependent hydrolase